MCDPLASYIFQVNNSIDLITSYSSTLLIIFINIYINKLKINLTQSVSQVASPIGCQAILRALGDMECISDRYYVT